MSSMTSEQGNITGTADKDYNLLWYTQACLDNAMRLDIYIQDAERAGDMEVAELFRKAQADSRKGAEQGKMLLDTDENRYLIPDVEALALSERRAFRRHVYW